MASPYIEAAHFPPESQKVRIRGSRPEFPQPPTYDGPQEVRLTQREMLVDAPTATVVIVSVAITELCALCRLWMRLRGGERRDQARYGHATAIAQLLVGSGRLGLGEHRIDGKGLSLRLSASPAEQSNGVA